MSLSLMGEMEGTGDNRNSKLSDLEKPLGDLLSHFSSTFFHVQVNISRLRIPAFILDPNLNLGKEGLSKNQKEQLKLRQ